VISFCVAIVGVGVITLFVPADASDAETAAKTPSLRDALQIWNGAGFRALVISAVLLSLATVSDAFVFLSLQDQLDLSAGLFPLLFVGVSLTNFALSAPIGRLADQRGRMPVFLGGHALLFVLYLVLLVPVDGPLRVFVCLFLLGAYYAATDGVLAAITAGSLRRDLCGSGLALIATGTNLGRLLSSVLFGVMWNSMGQLSATIAFVLGLGAALIVAVVLLRGHGDLARPSNA